MKSHKFLLSILLAIVLLSFAMVSPVLASPYFMIGQDQWQDALDEGKITGMDPNDWADYMVLWQDPCEGDPYPYNTFYEPELYVYEPSCDPDCRTNLYEDEITDFKDLAVFAEYWLQPCYDYSFLGDTGLVIAWGPSEQEPNNSTSSAWVFEYGEDPDLTNTLVTVTVNPPTRINAVSLGFEDINGKHMAWYWHCGPYGSSKPLSQGRPNMVTINTTLSGTAATIPQATGFFKQSGFDITHVQKLIVDENNQWLAGIQVPPPGQATSLIRPWNYWYNMVVSPNVQPPPPHFTKWNQPPLVMPPGFYYGWDEISDDSSPPVLADDWQCVDDRRITDVNFWGSFHDAAGNSWRGSTLPPVAPLSFHIGIWTDEPANPAVFSSFSHPKEMIWNQVVTNYNWQFVGFDWDPRIQRKLMLPLKPPLTVPPALTDSCFQFSCHFDTPFVQDSSSNNVYWLSIAAIYGPTPPTYLWGWKTRPHFPSFGIDDAVRITSIQGGGWPPAGTSKWAGGTKVEHPQGVSWDLSFELITDQPP